MIFHPSLISLHFVHDSTVLTLAGYQLYSLNKASPPVIFAFIDNVLDIYMYISVGFD